MFQGSAEKGSVNSREEQGGDGFREELRLEPPFQANRDFI
jgi:hypothetical protein